MNMTNATNNKAAAAKAAALIATDKASVAAAIKSSVNETAGMGMLAKAVAGKAAAEGDIATLSVQMVNALVGIMGRRFDFTYKMKDVKSPVAGNCTFAAYAAGKLESKAQQSGFKAAVGKALAAAGMNDETAFEGQWRYIIQDALPAAIAIRAAGCKTAIKDGKLTVTGGAKTGDKAGFAGKVRAAGSVRALKALANEPAALASIGAKPAAKADKTGKGQGAGKPQAKVLLAAQAAALVKALRDIAGKETVAGETAANLRALLTLIEQVAPASL
jgi:hypothetical protein